MKADIFAALLESAEEALAHSKGKQQLRTTALPGAPRLMGADEVRALREHVNASQAVFAHFLNVSTKLVQAWESNRRRPDGAALRLLEIAERDPCAVFHGLVLPDASRRSKRLSSKSKASPAARTKVTKAAPKVAKPAKRKLVSA